LITFDTILVIPTVTLNVGSSYFTQGAWYTGYNVIERAQLTWFCAQEALISSFYIVEIIGLIKSFPYENKRQEKVLYGLIAMNVVTIMMGILLVILEFVGFFTQITLKPIVYSVKLKLGFAVLGMLVSLVNWNRLR
jgi:hypothetical protein